MAIIHRTTLTPTKLELLASWLPSRPWYAGSGAPRPEKAGGFRLDDPKGEVGIEFMVITEVSAPGAAGYLVPMTYRGAPLDGAEQALIGTTEHGVLGRRWVYDGCQDPVLVAELLALIDGRVEAQEQSVSDAVDGDVTRSRTGAALTAEQSGLPLAEDSAHGTRIATADGPLLLHRVLTPAPEDAPVLPEGARGHVGGVWTLADGTRAHGLIVTLHTGTGQD
ncbi:maltokinase N-terminal cap-like domain-containing protein [Streptomyces nigra]|uniref:maltokinase N-terminal cap-like domain-containing protein n=1 Tax=Streptomyces nigra TaxID=1827580 RepID=UPI00365D12C0